MKKLKEVRTKTEQPKTWPIRRHITADAVSYAERKWNLIIVVDKAPVTSRYGELARPLLSFKRPILSIELQH